MSTPVDAEGRIAILKDDLPPSGTPSSPDELAASLREAGFAVEFLDSSQLADPDSLSRERFDLVVLPYGATFPFPAADNFRAFLRQGGKFLSTGGYAFDHLVERNGQDWQPVLAPPPQVTAAQWFCELPADELRRHGALTFSGFLKTARVSGGGMAYFAVYQHAADGTLLSWEDLCRVSGTEDWQECRSTFNVVAQAAVVRLWAGLYQCWGTAWFDDIRITGDSGEIVFEAGLEKDFDPDTSALRTWRRTDRRHCRVDAEIACSGRRSLRTELPPTAGGWLNTRHGIPEDGLRVNPDQLPVFDADYRLERVHHAQAAPGQPIVDSGFRIEGALEGYAACGIVGQDTGRWTPLINACDRYGRLRGAAGALLRHYDGQWAGSSWAFFGISNRDLFAESDMQQALVDVARALVRDTYFTHLVSERACYRQGEPVQLQAPVFNGGRQERALRVEIEIIPDDDASGEAPPVTVLKTDVQSRPGEVAPATVEWQPDRFDASFYRLVGRLWEGGQEIDRIESAFMVWDEQVVAGGPQLLYHDNYLHWGERSLFLFGTDDWSYVFQRNRETPLEWRADMMKRRDFGVTIYENLQFGLPESAEQEEALLRKVDGVAQLSQQYRQVYFPCLLVGYNVAVPDDELAQHQDFCRRYARRYAGVPGLVYYLNGDLRCRELDRLAPQWNGFLRQRYGSTERLREAWGAQAPQQELGEIPAADFSDRGQAWEDVRIYDLNCFRGWLIQRWAGALIEGIRDFDPTHPTTCEFYQLPHEGVDIPAGMGDMDLANFGFFDRTYDDLRHFPAICKYNDQRARGKTAGPGEYGCKTHPAWGDGKDYHYHITRTRQQAIELYLAIPHYALGLGASRVHNWCWKDGSHNIFPWGMNYPSDTVEKDILYVHRNQSLLFRSLAPVYQEPQVYLLTADSHRMGGKKWEVTAGIQQGIQHALALHVDNLGTLNEQDLAIPASAKVIFYPLPYCPPDEVYGKLLTWVKGGGVLYLSGDISYDEWRRRTRTGRLEELCGVRFIQENYPNIESGHRPWPNPGLREPCNYDQPCIKVAPAGATVLQTAGDGSPLVVEHRLGAGRVIFTNDPIELHPTPDRRVRDLAIYRSVLTAGGLQPIAMEPDDPQVHVLRVPLRDGGQAFVLFNTDNSRPERRVTLTGLDSPLTITVAAKRPALVWFDGKGNLRATETQGEATAGGRPLIVDDTWGIALSLDGEDLRRSRAVLLMPLQPGRAQLASQAAWQGPVAEVGEVRGGAWHTFEALPVQRGDDRVEVSVGEDQMYSLLILAEGEEMPRWRAAVENAMNEPGSLP